MKKFAAFFLCGVLLITSIGFTYNVYTCGISRHSKITLHPRSGCCGTREMPVGCCNNQLHFVKLTADYTTSSGQESPLTTNHILPFYNGALSQPSTSSDAYKEVRADLPHAPPILNGIRLHILFRTLLI